MSASATMFSSRPAFTGFTEITVEIDRYLQLYRLDV
jgi:hypothetical protein